MAFGFVPVCCIFLMLVSSMGGSHVHSSLVLSWWKAGGGGGSKDCGLNKLVFAGFPNRVQAGGDVLLSSGLRGDGGEGGPRFVFGFLRFGEQRKLEITNRDHSCTSPSSTPFELLSSQWWRRTHLHVLAASPLRLQVHMNLGVLDAAKDSSKKEEACSKLQMRHCVKWSLVLQDALDLHMRERDGTLPATLVLHLFAQLGPVMRGIADVHNMEMSIFSCCYPSAVGLVSIKGFLCLHRFTWCCYASLYVDEKEQNCYSLCCVLNANGFEDAMLENIRTFPFGLFHRWRVRTPLLLVLRFNGKGVVMVSSVKLTRNLQLGSFQPQMHMPIRSPGEPMGYYWRAHLMRPLDDYSCSCTSEFSPDPSSFQCVRQSIDLANSVWSYVICIWALI